MANYLNVGASSGIGEDNAYQLADGGYFAVRA